MRLRQGWRDTKNRESSFRPLWLKYVEMFMGLWGSDGLVSGQLLLSHGLQPLRIEIR